MFNLSSLVQSINRLQELKTRVLWVLQEPIYVEKLPVDYKTITNDEIDVYNKAAFEVIACILDLSKLQNYLQVLSVSSVDFWWSARLVAQGMVAESPDGIHLAKKPLQHTTQILLNMYCNDNMNFNDGTCCSSAETYTYLQIVTFLILVIW